jgi:hypothetical protein
MPRLIASPPRFRLDCIKEIIKVNADADNCALSFLPCSLVDAFHHHRAEAIIIVAPDVDGHNIRSTEVWAIDLVIPARDGIRSCTNHTLEAVQVPVVRGTQLVRV